MSSRRLFGLAFGLPLVALLVSSCGAPAATPVQAPTAPPTSIPPTNVPVAATPKAAKVDDATVAKIEAIVKQHMDVSQVPGAALCVVKDGQVVYEQGFGVADMETKAPVTPDTLFKMASVTKTFTAAAIMQLVEQGKIDLDAKATDYLPWFTMADERYKDITVRQLMSHRAGIPPLEDPIEPFYLSWGFDKPQLDDQAMERRVRDLSGETLRSKPGGVMWAYSDWGFTVLGMIVAAVSGQSYEDYVTQHLLRPLGMDSSSLLMDDVDPDQLASPHVNDASGKVVVSPVYPFNRSDTPADSLIASCADMARWLQVGLNRGELDGARILQPSSYDAMWEPISETGIKAGLGPIYGPPFEAYGLGSYVGTADGQRLVGHAGVDPGFNSQFIMAPDDELGVVALANWQSSMNTPYPAFWIATDVIYELLGVNKQ